MAFRKPATIGKPKISDINANTKNIKSTWNQVLLIGLMDV
jgi:hypothetical protein